MARARWWCRLGGAAVLIATLLAMAGAGPNAATPVARAQSISAGCELLNMPYWDTLEYFSASPGELTFNAGDQIRITARRAVDGSLTSVELWVDTTVVDTAPFPGTVTYTFPATGLYEVYWIAIGLGNARWSVECVPALRDGRVMICHTAGMAAARTLTVAPQAVQAHVAHGDTLGPC